MARLKNYLRSNRKYSALSQDDVAFLLGTQSGSKVCRYERFEREPSLATALACEVIFGKPASELFAGLHNKVERDVAARAKSLAYRINREQPSVRGARRWRTLSKITSRSDN